MGVGVPHILVAITTSSLPMRSILVFALLLAPLSLLAGGGTTVAPLLMPAAPAPTVSVSIATPPSFYAAQGVDLSVAATRSTKPKLASKQPTKLGTVSADGKTVKLTRKDIKTLIKTYRAEMKAQRKGQHSVSAAAAAAEPQRTPSNSLRLRLILGLIGIGAAVVFYAVGEPVAGTIFLILGLGFFIWWMFDYL
jgi:hypothetical protein